MKHRSRNRRRQQLEETAEELTYDKAAKEVLAMRQILAPILKNIVPEYRQLSLETIMHDCIEGKPWVGTVPVDPGRTNRVFRRRLPKKIRGLQTEQNASGEGWITYDVLFYARIPGTDQRVRFIINIEAQRNDPNYKLMKRAIFYASRLISSQKEREFTGQDYDNICKVYTIWLCFYLPEGEQSSINRYELRETNIYGVHHEEPSDYDLIHVTTVHVGDDEPENELLRFLQLIFLQQMTELQKSEGLREEFGIDVQDDTRKGLGNMCNLSSGLKERAEAIGEARGAARGEARGEKRGREQTWVASVRNLMKSMQMTAQQAAEALAVPAEIRQKVLEQV